MPPPLKIPDDLPPLKERIRFRTSPVYEMLISLHALRYPEDYPISMDWIRRTRPRLTPEQTAALDFFYTRFYGGMGLAEIAEGYEDHDDVEGFLRHVENLSDTEFLWYPLGRINSEEEIAAVLAGRETLPNLIARNDYITADQVEEFEPLFADPAGNRERLSTLWRSYWHTIFAAECENYRPGWERSIAVCQGHLAQIDAESFLEEIAICSSSRQFLVDSNIPEVWLIPSYYRATSPLSFYTDNSMTIIYDARGIVQRRTATEHKLDDALILSKALNDRTRLRLLSYIYHHEGTKTVAELAEALDISQPTASRHLRILREAGILNEQRVGNRVFHTVNLDRITSLSDTIMTSLKS
ncbi:MAG: metalloregulator ArsR/SmtB family transcription factor [Promethearchaeota archaeon]